MQRKCRCCSVERAAEEAKSEKPVSSSGLAWAQRQSKAKQRHAHNARQRQRAQDRRHRLWQPNLQESGIITQERRKPARCRYWPEGQCFLANRVSAGSA